MFNVDHSLYIPSHPSFPLNTVYIPSHPSFPLNTVGMDTSGHQRGGKGIAARGYPRKDHDSVMMMILQHVDDYTENNNGNYPTPKYIDPVYLATKKSLPDITKPQLYNKFHHMKKRYRGICLRRDNDEVITPFEKKFADLSFLAWGNLIHREKQMEDDAPVQELQEDIQVPEPEDIPAAEEEEGYGSNDTFASSDSYGSSDGNGSGVEELDDA